MPLLEVCSPGVTQLRRRVSLLLVRRRGVARGLTLVDDLLVGLLEARARRWRRPRIRATPRIAAKSCIRTATAGRSRSGLSTVAAGRADGTLAAGIQAIGAASVGGGSASASGGTFSFARASVTPAGRSAPGSKASGRALVLSERGRVSIVSVVVMGIPCPLMSVAARRAEHSSEALGHPARAPCDSQRKRSSKASLCFASSSLGCCSTCLCQLISEDQLATLVVIGSAASGGRPSHGSGSACAFAASAFACASMASVKSVQTPACTD